VLLLISLQLLLLLLLLLVVVVVVVMTNSVVGFDSRRYQIFWEVVGLERGPHSLLSTTEELLERKIAAPV
jgi:hypothetical protein